MPMPDQLTEIVMWRRELEAIDKTVELANLLGQLPDDQHEDLTEVIAHLHGIQDWIASRCVFRAINRVEDEDQPKA